MKEVLFDLGLEGGKVEEKGVHFQNVMDGGGSLNWKS